MSDETGRDAALRDTRGSQTVGVPIFPKGSPFSRENGDPGSPFSWGSPKFYDTGPPTFPRGVVVGNAEMAGRRQAFQSNPELQQFLIPDVRPTGKQLGVGSYGSVEELEMNGLVCAGKRLHDALLQRDNAGVPNLERKYIEECQVMPTGYWEKCP